MIGIGGNKLPNGQRMGVGLQEDRTLSFLIGNSIRNKGNYINVFILLRYFKLLEK